MLGHVDALFNCETTLWCSFAIRQGIETIFQTINQRKSLNVFFANIEAVAYILGNYTEIL